MCLSLTVGLWARNWMFPNVSRDRQETSITVITVVVKLVLGSSFNFQFSVLTHSRKGPHTGKAPACSRGSHAHTYTQIDRHTHTHRVNESSLRNEEAEKEGENTLVGHVFSPSLQPLQLKTGMYLEEVRRAPEGGGIHWVVGKWPVLLTVCVFALFTVPSLACSRSVHWNHISWNIFHHFCLNCWWWEKTTWAKLKRSRNFQTVSRSARGACLSNFDWILLF